jgi:predicted GIY-YIG superfamily endonuclease
MTCGIYILTSPSGKKYIGQSINIENRFWKHAKSSLQCLFRELL